MASANILGADGVVAKQYLPPIFTGDITAVIAGTGLGGGGVIGDVTLTNIGVLSVDATPGGKITVDNTDPQNPKIANDGVLSVVAGDGIAVDNTNPNDPIVSTNVLAGMYYKSAQQNAATGTAATTTITFENTVPWSDTTAITRTSTTAFTVNRKGLYHLQLQVTNGVNSGATFSTDTNYTSIRLTRGATPATTILQQTASGYAYVLGQPATRSSQCSGYYELEVGDILGCAWTASVSSAAGTVTIWAPAPAFDYNTYFAWEFIKPLP